MTPSHEGFEREELARHAAWLRSLARALVGEAAADDVAQDAWVAALRRAPADVALRPWLARVARNFAFQRHRGSARRRAYEAHARPPSEPSDPASVAERIDAERALLDAFEALREPYKSALFLRFWHDLAPREIAERLRVPAGTVRWRLSEGLAELRRVLDARGGGERGAWGAVVLPLLRTEKGTLATAGTVTGVFVMSQAVKIGIAAAALAVVGTGVLVVQRSQSRTLPAPPVSTSGTVALEAPVTPPIDAPLLAEQRGERRAAAELVDGPPENALAAEERFIVTARFVDEDGVALPDVVLEALFGEHPSATSGVDGEVRVAIDAEERSDGYLITLVARRAGLATRWLETVVRTGEVVALGTTVLGPGGRASGQVTEADGRRVAGASVTCIAPGAPGWLLGNPELAHTRTDTLGLVTVSADDEGRFVLDGLPPGPSKFVAALGNRGVATDSFREVWPGEELTDLTIVLPAPEPRRVAIRGRVLDPEGAPLPRAVLRVSGAEPEQAFTDAEGRFSLGAEPGASFSVTATDAAEAFVPARAEGTADADRTLELSLERPRAVTLRVADERGTAVERYAFSFKHRPTASAGAVWGRAQRAGFVEERPGGTCEVFFSRDPLYLGVLAPGYVEANVGPFTHIEVPGVLEVVLERAVTIEGRVTVGDEPLAGGEVRLCLAYAEGTRTEKNGFRARYDGDDPLDTVQTADDGSFVLTPRMTGTYFVRALADGLAPLDAGPMAFDGTTPPAPVTLALGVGGAIQGRVVRADGESPEGTIIGISRADGTARTQRVDASGVYRFEGLTPGRWLVVTRDTEISPHSSAVAGMSDHASDTESFDWNCTVEHGETTELDLVVGRIRLEGTLRVDGEPGLGWSARLTPGEGVRRGAATELDSRGRFELAASTPGPRTLELDSPWRADAHRFGVLRAEIMLAHGVTRWELALETGTLVVEGGGPWDESKGGLVWVWENAEGAWAFGAVAPGDDGVARITLPAGRIRLVRPGERAARDVRNWETSALATVTAGGTARIRML